MDTSPLWLGELGGFPHHQNAFDPASPPSAPRSRRLRPAPGAAISALPTGPVAVPAGVCHPHPLHQRPDPALQEPPVSGREEARGGRQRVPHPLRPERSVPAAAGLWELGGHRAAPWEMLFYAFFLSFSSKSAFAPRSDDAAAGEWPAGRALPSLVTGRSGGSSLCPQWPKRSLSQRTGRVTPRPTSLLLAGVPVPRTSSRSARPRPLCMPERLRVGWDNSGSLGTPGAVYVRCAALQSPRCAHRALGSCSSAPQTRVGSSSPRRDTPPTTFLYRAGARDEAAFSLSVEIHCLPALRSWAFLFHIF